MTREDYEARYAEALEVVRGRIPRKTASEPKTSPFGKRFVIGGRPTSARRVKNA
jgi:hypothetical protein